MRRCKTWWNLFQAFFRIGIFAFGGGFAMLPLIEREIIDRHGWATKDEIINIYALAQAVPGAIGVNTAIFIGGRLYGVPGAVIALLGVVTPSVLIILIIAHFFAQFQSNVYFARAFNGVRGAVVGLIAAAALRISRSAVKDKFGLFLAAAALVLSVFDLIHVIWIMLLGGLAGSFYYYFKGQGS